MSRQISTLIISTVMHCTLHTNYDKQQITIASQLVGHYSDLNRPGNIARFEENQYNDQTFFCLMWTLEKYGH